MVLNGTLPDFRDWSVAAVRLLQGVVYLDDGPVWGILCSNKTRLEEYFARLGLALGGQRETFMGLAGMGDLVLTCTGDLSRNRRLGLALGRRP